MLHKAPRCSLCGRFSGLVNRYGMCGSCARGLRGRVHKSEFDATFDGRVRGAMQALDRIFGIRAAPVVGTGLTVGQDPSGGVAIHALGAINCDGGLNVSGAGKLAGLVTPYYAIGSQGGTYSTASTSLVAVDGTNLSITTPVVPNTSSIRVRAYGSVGTAADSTDFYVAIHDSNDGIVAVVQGRAPASTPLGAFIPFYVEAVYAGGEGVAHTFQLYWKTGSAGDAAQMLNGSNGNPFPVMVCEVNQ